MPRILAIDYGKKRTGLAVTDPMQIIAGGLDTVPTTDLMAYLRSYISKNEVSVIVIGLPKQMSGEYSESFKYIKPFSDRLKKEFSSIDVVFYDERFTSKIAMQSMIAGGVKKSDRRNKELVDKVSAVIILQSYMESKQVIF